jgi:hypothetical protein
MTDDLANKRTERLTEGAKNHRAVFDERVSELCIVEHAVMAVMLYLRAARRCGYTGDQLSGTRTTFLRTFDMLIGLMSGRLDPGDADADDDLSLMKTARVPVHMHGERLCEYSGRLWAPERQHRPCLGRDDEVVA